MHRKPSRFRRFESLENRAMMAGDFAATYDAGTQTLTLTGDAQDNSFTFVGDGIGGFTFTGTNGTTINGLPGFVYDSVNFPVQNLIVDFGDGDDSAQVYGLAGSSLTTVDFTGGLGSDVFQFGSFVAFNTDASTVDSTTPTLDITGSLTISGGEGADLVEIVSVNGGGTWTIDLGDASADPNNTANTDAILDNDLIGIDVDDQLYIYIATAGDIAITGGTGDDVVNINYLVAQGTLDIDTGAGQDLISIFGSAFNDTVTLNAGDDADLIVIDYCRDDAAAGNTITINGGNGGDFVRVARSLFDNATLTINGDAGADLILVGLYSPANDGNYVTGGNVIDTLNVNGGDDGDAVDIRANQVVDFFANLGGGDDDLDLLYNLATGSAAVDGGAGFDYITALGNDAAGYSAVGFENENDVFAAYV